MRKDSSRLYVLSSRVSFRVLGSGVVEVSFLDDRYGRKLCLTLELHQALLRFTRPAKAGPSDQPFLAAGLLVPASSRPESEHEADEEEGFSIESVLNPKVFSDLSLWQGITRALKAGRLCLIQDAFRPKFADRIHRSLGAVEDWDLRERFDQPYFSYRYHNLNDPDLYPKDLKLCRKIWGSAATRRFMGKLAGCDASGPVQFSGTHYFPGDFALPHTDVSDTRSLA